MLNDTVTRMRSSNDKLKDQLSPVTYAYKQIRALVINAVGFFGGGYLGWQAGGNFKSKPLSPNVTELVESLGETAQNVAKNPRMLGTMIGAAVGTVSSLLILGYEHWAKAEAARLATDEINHDISEAKLRMNPELIRENHLLREMVAKQDRPASSHESDKDKPVSTVSATHASLEPLEKAANRQHEHA